VCKLGHDYDMRDIYVRFGREARVLHEGLNQTSWYIVACQEEYDESVLCRYSSISDSD
jgi:hypothetical protein